MGGWPADWPPSDFGWRTLRLSTGGQHRASHRITSVLAIFANRAMVVVKSRLHYANPQRQFNGRLDRFVVKPDFTIMPVKWCAPDCAPCNLRSRSSKRSLSRCERRSTKVIPLVSPVATYLRVRKSLKLPAAR